MDKMRKARKGLLFSISAFIIASALLYLALSFSTYLSSLKDTTSVLSNFERLQSKSDSAEYGFRMISRNSGINVSISGNNITLEANGSHLQTYLSDIARFEQFLEVNASLNTSITSDASVIKLIIMPQDILVNYSATDLSISPKNASYSSGGVSDYDVILKIPTPTPRFNWTQAFELSQADPNALYIHIGVQGNNGTVSTEKYLDKYATSSVQLLNPQNQPVIRISIISPAALTIQYNLDTYLKITLGLDSTTYVGLSSTVINATLGLGGEKESTVIWRES